MYININMFSLIDRLQKIMKSESNPKTCQLKYFWWFHLKYVHIFPKEKLPVYHSNLQAVA